MTITSDNIQVVSSSPTGATIATDLHTSTGKHFQVVKINTGSDGVDSLLGDSTPIPIKYSPSSSIPYVPVRGNTLGTMAVPVSISGGAALTVVGITIGGGTLHHINGASMHIQSIESGVTIDTQIQTVASGVTIGITGDVKLLAGDNNIGNVDVVTVAAPSGVVFGHHGACAGTGMGQPLCELSFQSGVRITNFDTTNVVYIGGPTGASTSNAYPLLPLDTIFLEVSHGTACNVVTIAGVTADVRWIAT
tara:strand:+ start:6872 stop:7618 length:747 start_codon:yes stop_codon:yes gene_type:complete